MSAMELSPCPFCGSEMMLRQALWPHDGDRDSIIHQTPQNGPDGLCGLIDFSVGTADEGITVTQAWNRRSSPATDLLREAREDERAKIIAWLRTDNGKGTDEGADYADSFADQIQNGVHLSTPSAPDPRVVELVRAAEWASNELRKRSEQVDPHRRRELETALAPFKDI